MANTTNFNWETPDDTDLVKDGAAAIRTLGSAIDTSLVDLKGGTTDQVLAKNSNTDMDFKWVTSDDANAIQNSIIDAKGDLIVGSAADTPARLAVGTNGHTLVADSSTATGLAWAAPAGGGGKVLQVVSTAKTDSFSTATAAFTDVTGLSVSITPSAATSKVLVMVTLSSSARDGQGDSGMRLLRGSTDIAIGDAAGSRTRVSQDIILTNVNAAKSINLVYLDSPATTSSTTYKIQVAGLAPSSGWTTYVNRSYDDADAANRSRSISTITVLEIGA